ncbi:MAG TPA: hypothetical protein VFO90_02495, partial [Terrimicrobiaceae bacterium]|nr:hypothetical protein [Terrimicrobiaceae bacterium]
MRIGRFYANLFECGFLIHPVLSGLGVVIVKISSPESVFRGIFNSGRSTLIGTARRLPFRGFQPA